MTIEPKAVDNMKANKLANNLEIVALPESWNTRTSFHQAKFNERPYSVIERGRKRSDRIAEPMHLKNYQQKKFLAEILVFSALTDAVVVSGSSNVAQMAYLLAGEQGQVWSIDTGFTPLTLMVCPAFFVSFCGSAAKVVM